MILKKKAQLSFEFILLFSLMMLIFIIAGTILISALEHNKQIESQAGYIAKEIKSSAILASLSESDFHTNVTIPSTIAGQGIYVDIHKTPDNLVVIKQLYTGSIYRVIAQEFLPNIDADGVNLENLNNVTIIIGKVGTNMTIKLAN